MDLLPPVELRWPCDNNVASISAEHALSPVVLKPGEFGRGSDLPARRLVEVDAACALHGMTRFQALSLRRQLLRSRPRGMRRVNHSAAVRRRAL